MDMEGDTQKKKHRAENKICTKNGGEHRKNSVPAYTGIVWPF